MGQVIELCRTCGFDIPADADRCPTCEPARGPSLAARQVAGLALPTRSLHAVPGVRARREHDVRPLGRARAARSAFSFTATLAAVTFAVAGLAWAADLPRFVLQVPDGTSERLDGLATFTAAASVATLLLGLVAMVVWCVRATFRQLRSR